MCTVNLILNKKPKTSNPCSIDWLKPGEHMHMGKHITINMKTTFDLVKDKVSQSIVITHHFGIYGVIKRDTQAINKVIDLTELCGIRVTPLATSFVGNKQNGVLLFVELTKSLDEALKPAS